jgi:DNA-binding beta-propeller fold protein YncE
MIVGDGQFRYELAEGWEQLPDGWEHKDVAGVATDSRDRVYVFTRSEHPVIVYEQDGTFIRSWGEGVFSPRPHGITIGPDDSVYCVDDADHTVRKFSPEGELLMTLGTSGQPSDTGYTGTIPTIVRPGEPFNRPTNLSIAPNGELYVSDGYGNCRVHRFSADGELLQSWGEPGTGPGQFNLPHGIWVLGDGRVLVADRENDRIQVFSPTGEYVTEWTDVQRPTALFADRDGLVYVSELAWWPGQQSYRHGPISEYRPARVCVMNDEGQVQARWGGPEPCADGSFCAPHGLYADSRGDVYVGEVTWTFAGSRGLVPPDCHTFQKFARVRQ